MFLKRMCSAALGYNDLKNVHQFQVVDSVVYIFCVPTDLLNLVLVITEGGMLKFSNYTCRFVSLHQIVFMSKIITCS